MPPQNQGNYNNPPQPFPPKQKKSQAIIIFLVIVAIAAIFLGYGYYKTKPTSILNENKISEPALEQTTSYGQAWDYVLLGESKKCTSTLYSNESKSTMYIAQNRLRNEIDFQEKSIGNRFVIMDGQNEYAWNDRSNVGIKNSINITLQQFVQDVKSKGSSIGFTAHPDQYFACSDWQADLSLFVPPSNIKFEIQKTEASLGDRDQQNKFSTFGSSSEIYFENNHSYIGWCNSIEKPAGEYLYTCRESKDEFVIFTTLRTGKIYCTDKTHMRTELDAVPQELSCY